MAANVSAQTATITVATGSASKVHDMVDVNVDPDGDSVKGNLEILVFNKTTGKYEMKGVNLNGGTF